MFIGDADGPASVAEEEAGVRSELEKKDVVGTLVNTFGLVMMLALALASSLLMERTGLPSTFDMKEVGTGTGTGIDGGGATIVVA